MTTYKRIVTLLNEHQATFRVIDHPAEGRTELISAIRGNAPEQAAKAMVIQVITDTKQPCYALVIVPRNSKVNFKTVAKLMGGKKSSFAPPKVAQTLTKCEMGAVPPFSFNNQLTLLVDENIANVDTLFFNAGRLDKSIALNLEDYFRIVGKNCLVSFHDC